MIMKDGKNLKRLMLYVGILFLFVGLNSCSDDDDGTVTPLPTGEFNLDSDEYTLMDNTIVLESITVGQTSWLTAVNVGSEATNDFIADPVRLQQGENTNVELVFDEGAITDDGEGQQIVLRLYDDTGSMTGSWDATDRAIAVTETITVFEASASFADFDADGNGTLDANEFPATYQNNFDEWDADGDGSLSSEEFYNTTFANTDADDDDGISSEEWDAGFAAMFGGWNDDDFDTFDANADDILSLEEWNTAFADSDWFDTYDANTDTLVSEDEWDTGLFGDWDTNDDDLIDENEFNVYSPYVMAW